MASLLPIAKALGQAAPPNSGTVAIQNRFNEAAIVAGGGADVAWLTRKQIFYALPLIIAWSISDHVSALFTADSA